MILKMMEEAVSTVRKCGYTPVYAALYGSQNYGLDIYSEDAASDYDFKVIVMPTIHDVVFKKSNVSTTIEYSGGLIDVKSAIEMTELYGKCNQQYLETLITPFYQIYPGGEYMEKLRKHADDLVNERKTLFVNSVVGHFANKYKELFDPRRQDEDVYIRKQACHALRLTCMLEDFKKTGRCILHPAQDDREIMLDIKRGKYEIEQLLPMANGWRERIRIAAYNFPGCDNPVDTTLDLMRQETKKAWYHALCKCGLASVGHMEDV